MSGRDEHGYSLLEMLVALALFSVVGAGFMSVMISVARGTDATAGSVRVSEEARLSLNRMVRDTREAGWISLGGTDPNVTHDSFTVKIDYNGDGAYTNPATGVPDANYEVVTYAYDDANDRVTLTAPGVGTETLARGVDCIRDVNDQCIGSVFTFTSNRLEYDWDGDGVTSLAEINATACSPRNVTTFDVCNTTLVDRELATITSVTFALEITAGGRSSDYFTEAQLRNRR